MHHVLIYTFIWIDKQREDNNLKLQGIQHGDKI